MKGFLIFLACACPVVLASPFFWSLVNMEVGAEPVGYVQQDGTTQWATIGPKSYWPDWALRPDGASVRVDSHFSATPTLAASGMATVTLKEDQRTAAGRFESRLEAAGFETARYSSLTWSPDLPPRQFVFCVIEGVQRSEPVRTIRFSFSVESDAMPARLHWTEGSLPPVMGMQPSPCF